MAISREAFDQLKAGDVIIYNGRPRTVMIGPGDMRELPQKSNRCLTLPIKMRSWTNRAQTVQGYNDLKHKIRLPRKALDIKSVCVAELDQLRSIGFDPVKELEREIASEERLQSITGRLQATAIRVAKAKLKRLKRKA